jgi:hypothetical protein
MGWTFEIGQNDGNVRPVLVGFLEQRSEVSAAAATELDLSQVDPARL